jgi:peptide deformylase
MVREILIWPDPKLREQSKPVEKVDDEIRQLVDDMFETMRASNGVGLAAPQVGVSKRVVVIDVSARQEEIKPLVLINPKITRTEGERVYEEGCLSVPGEAEEVVRADKVWVTALDRDGREFSLEADQLLAIAVQHELDHLDGTLFVDRISALKRELIKRRMKRVKAERAAKKLEAKKAPATPVG